MQQESSNNQNESLAQAIARQCKGKSLEALIANDITRKALLTFVDQKIKTSIMNDENYPLRAREDKYYMVRNLLLVADQAYRNAKNAPAVRKAIINSFLINNYLKPKPQIEKFKQNLAKYRLAFCLSVRGNYAIFIASVAMPIVLLKIPKSCPGKFLTVLLTKKILSGDLILRLFREANHCFMKIKVKLCLMLPKRIPMNIL